jgi:hypothetical protein
MELMLLHGGLARHVEQTHAYYKTTTGLVVLTTCLVGIWIYHQGATILGFLGLIPKWNWGLSDQCILVKETGLMGVGPPIAPTKILHIFIAEEILAFQP